MQENLQKIITIRKTVLNNHFKNLAGQQAKFDNKSEYFWLLIKEIKDVFENELDLFNGNHPFGIQITFLR